MKKLLIILCMSIAVIACHHSSTPTPSSTPNPPSTASTNTTTLTGIQSALVGNWILDSTIQYSNNAIVVRTIPNVAYCNDWSYNITGTSCGGTSTLHPNNIFSDKTTSCAGTSGCWYLDTAAYSMTTFVRLGGIPMTVSGTPYIRGLTAHSLIISDSYLTSAAPKTGNYAYLHK